MAKIYFCCRPEELLISAFNSSTEELKTAASYSLGRLAVGNLEKYLPFLLKQISAQPKRQYLLLHSLKEVCPVFLRLVEHTGIGPSTKLAVSWNYPQGAV